MMNKVNALAKRLAQIRNEQKLSRAELAEKIGVVPETIARYERGDREPRSGELRKLASALGVSVAYLMGETERFDIDTNSKAIDNKFVPVYPIPVFDISDFREGYPVDEQAKGVTYVTQALMGPVDDGQPPFALSPSRWSLLESEGISDAHQIAVNPAMPFENGKLCFIRYNGVPMVRRVYRDPDGSWSLQSDLPPITASPESVEFIGRVRGAILDVE